MLDVSIDPHREFLLAGSAGQKLFIALTLRPKVEAAGAKPPLAVVFVVDTSGSMREVVAGETVLTGETYKADGKSYNRVTGGLSKMDLVISALRAIFESEWLDEKDRIGLVKFDDSAEVLTDMSSAQGKARLLAASDRLSQYSGGTQMGDGLRLAVGMLKSETGSRRIVLLTDGQTTDEDLVETTGGELAAENIPVTAIGFGNDWNADLLTKLTDRTQGKPVHVVPASENPMPPSVKASELPSVFLSEMRQAANEVVTAIALRVRTTKDVRLDRITRVQPALNEVDLRNQPAALGNAEAGGDTSFVLEMTLAAKNPSRFRVAQIGLTYEVPGKGYRGEVPPIDVIVEFTTDETAAARTNPGVMRFVQMRNVEALVLRAQQEAVSNPAQAMKTMELARSMTQRLGNHAMTRSLDSAITELRSNKTISPGTSKTLRIGSKTQVLKPEQPGGLPSDDDIRRITGA